MQLDRIDPSFGHWFAGLVDGEGHFGIRRAHMQYKSTRYVVYSCQFAVSLRADDLPTLTQIQRELGIGKIRPVSRSKDPKRVNENPAYRFDVVSKPAAVALVAFFDRFPLRSKKARDYALWRQAVVEWQKTYRGHRTFDWAPMAQLKTELELGRRYRAV